MTKEILISNSLTPNNLIDLKTYVKIVLYILPLNNPTNTITQISLVLLKRSQGIQH